MNSSIGNTFLLFRWIIRMQSVEVIKNCSTVNVRWMFVRVNCKLIFTLLHRIIAQNKRKKLVKLSTFLTIWIPRCFFCCLEYSEGCDYDEPLLDSTSNRPIECDTIDRCPFNSYCNKQTNRCCVKVLTAMSPYRMCLDDEQCGRNMICRDGFCQCATEDLMPAKHKRECSRKNHRWSVEIIDRNFFFLF